MEVGLGTMGMSADEFWDLSPREFHFKMKGYYEREMLKEQEAWERSRWESYLMVLAHGDGKKQITPQDLIVFPWEKDKKTTAKPITQEELERAKKLYDGHKPRS